MNEVGLHFRILIDILILPRIYFQLIIGLIATTMEQQTIKDIPTARILLLGDSGSSLNNKLNNTTKNNENLYSLGVGKSRLADLLACSVDTPTPSTRTVGNGWWNVQVRLHEYPCNDARMPPTPEETSASSPSSASYSSEHHACNKLLFLRNARTTRQMIPYFVEFYDLKSSMRLTREHRNHLYRNIDGIILVYDLLDMKTHDNLHDWLYQPLRQICRHRHKRLRPILRRRHVPILVVGTKLDMLKSRRLRRSGSIADQLGTDEILLNCLDANSLAEKTRNEGKLRKFLNKAVDFKQYFPSRRSY